MARSLPAPRALLRRARGVPAVRSVADATRTRRSVAAIRRSGLFDAGWYLEQLDGGDAPEDPVEHFVTSGAERGLQPHPLFDPATYLDTDPAARRSGADPFTHFLTRGAARGHDPHPLFDAALVAGRHPEAASHPAGPLGWYLADLDRELDPPLTWVDRTSVPTPAAYLDLVRAVHRAHRRVRDLDDFPRVYDRFDHDAAAAVVPYLRERAAAERPPPVVSVVLPTRDRADTVVAAIDSVLAQTWPYLELLVVDDGSTDETPDVVGRYDDPRVRYLPLSPSGVSRARNHGLDHATGRFVAYLDSDNTWVPEHLEAMVGFLVTERARAAYSAIELRGDDGVRYRGAPLDREALRERNYIDLNTLVHERALIDEVGGFDVELRRVVDWDLLLRIADRTDLHYVPFVGALYDDRASRTDRLTHAEATGYGDLVRSRRLIDLASAPDTVPGRDSVLFVPRQADGEVAAASVATSLRRIRETASDRDVEVVVVDDGTHRAEALRLRALATLEPDLRFERLSYRVNLATALDLAASRASGDVLLVLDPILAIDPDAVFAAADAVRRGDATAAQPLLVSDHDGTVVSSGFVADRHGTPVHVGWQLAPQDALVRDRTGRDALDLAACAVETAAFRACGGFDPVMARLGAAIDLGRRLRSRGGSCVVVPEVETTVDVRSYHRRWQVGVDDARELVRRSPPVEPTLEAWSQGSGVEVVGATPVPRHVVGGAQRWVPQLVRAGARPRRWAIKIGADGPDGRQRWGDWHFALALRSALEELGEHAVVDLRRAWYRPSSSLDDVDLVLRGVASYDVPPGRRTALWVISHPREVTAEEVRTYDQVFVASAPFAQLAAERWDRPVEPLLQCTDPDRFRAAPDPALRTELLFVGNSRGVRRRIVADAIEAGLEPTIWGAGWEGLVPDHLVRGDHVPNEELARHYASADVVLADHWDDMRELGFVANRIYDAVASGASVVSDDVPGLDGAFGGAVRTYRSTAELVDVVAAARAHRPVDGATTVDGDTFLDRARQLVAWADGAG